MANPVLTLEAPAAAAALLLLVPRPEHDAALGRTAAACRWRASLLRAARHGDMERTTAARRARRELRAVGFVARRRRASPPQHRGAVLPSRALTARAAIARAAPLLLREFGRVSISSETSASSPSFKVLRVLSLCS